MTSVVGASLSLLWMLTLVLLFFCGGKNLWQYKYRLPVAFVTSIVGGVLTQIVGWSGWALLFVGGVVSADMLDIVPGRETAPLERSIVTRMFFLVLILAVAMTVRYLVFCSI